MSDIERKTMAKAKYSKTDSRGALYVDCSECERGGNGDAQDKCSCGWRVKRGKQGGCFIGTLRAGLTIDSKPVATGLFDDSGMSIMVGDLLLSKYGYHVTVQCDADGGFSGKLVCDPSHSCANIPYALNGGKDYTVCKQKVKQGRVTGAVCTVLLACGLALCGCKSETVSVSAPANIRAQVTEAEAAARACIVSSGTRLDKRAGVRVVTRPGTRKFGGMWAWYSEEWGQFIGGMYSGTTITVACNPDNVADVYMDTLVHEFGHHWLVSNYGWNHYGSDCKHDPRYADCLPNWRLLGSAVVGAKSIDKATLRAYAAKLGTDARSGTFSVSGVDLDGQFYHIDFVSEGAGIAHQDH